MTRIEDLANNVPREIGELHIQPEDTFAGFVSGALTFQVLSWGSLSISAGCILWSRELRKTGRINEADEQRRMAKT